MIRLGVHATFADVKVVKNVQRHDYLIWLMIPEYMNN